MCMHTSRHQATNKCLITQKDMIVNSSTFQLKWPQKSQKSGNSIHRFCSYGPRHLYWTRVKANLVYFASITLTTLLEQNSSLNMLEWSHSKPYTSGRQIGSYSSLLIPSTLPLGRRHAVQDLFTCLALHPHALQDLCFEVRVCLSPP